LASTSSFYQPGGTGEAHSALLPAGGYRQPGEEVSFTGPAVADEDDRLGPSDVTALSKLVNLLRRDLMVPREIELVEGLHSRQMRFANAPGYEPLFAFLEFGLQQRFEIAQVCSALSNRLLGKLGALCSDGW
jgi:hypothetical protein